MLAVFPRVRLERVRKGGGRDSRRRSVTGNMASKAKKRAVGNGVQRPLGATGRREEEEEEDEVEDEEEEDEDSEEEEDEDDEIVDEVRGTRDHIFSCRCDSGSRSCGNVVGDVGSCDFLPLWYRTGHILTQVLTAGFSTHYSQ